MEFTTKKYRVLLESLKISGFQFFTFEEYCSKKSEEKFIILRHDVDLKPDRSLALAEIESELEIKSTYFFRIVPESNQPSIIKQIADLRHEIAYHYEDLTLAKGDAAKAYEAYKKNLDYFRQFYPVKTIAMHGSPASKFDNRHLWKHYNYHDFGIIGEPYFDFINEGVNNIGGSRCYFTDTAGMWDGDKYNVRDKAVNNSSAEKVRVHTTDDLILFLTSDKNVKEVMINTHPQRWTDNKATWLFEYVTQKAKNRVKKIIVNRRKE